GKPPMPRTPYVAMLRLLRREGRNKLTSVLLKGNRLWRRRYSRLVPMVGPRLAVLAPGNDGGVALKFEKTRVALPGASRGLRLRKDAVRNHAQGLSRRGVLLEELYGVADRKNVLSGVVRNLASELFLESHNKLNRVQAVGAEIINEAGVLRDL